MELPKRKTPRIPGYDYSGENYYFVTVCTHEKECLLGTIEKKNRFGEIAEEELLRIGTHYTGVCVDKAMVMPNHIHAIVVIGCDNRNVKYPSLNTVIGQYKAGVTRRIRDIQPEKKGVAKIVPRSYHPQPGRV